jgi:hypothetical protein
MDVGGQCDAGHDDQDTEKLDRRPDCTHGVIGQRFECLGGSTFHVDASGEFARGSADAGSGKLAEAGGRTNAILLLCWT